MFRRHGLQMAAAICCAAALFATSASAGNEGPGAPGVGDDYFPSLGNGGYDVSHYDIQVRYQPADDHLRGTTTIVAKPTQNLTALNLDFALTAKSVRVNGMPAKFSQNGAEMTVTPAEPLPKDSLATVVVDYEGVPSKVEIAGKMPWIRTSDGALAVGQPLISSWWFPGNDHPQDKATYDISVAVPDGTEVLSNGWNTGNDSLAGWTTWKWRTTKPTATYLAFVAIGQYELNTKTGAFGQPFVTAYSDKLGEYEGAAKASIERTPEIVEFLTSLFGDYPFEAQGGVVASEGLNFALENQTRPTYSHLFFRRGANTSVVVHENAHQWFGDSVSVNTWRNIWINEGFATYAEWLWSERQGTGTAQELFNHYYAKYPAGQFWEVLPGDPGANDLFHKAVYDRGAMTLHALRNVVGDATFFDIIRTWVSEKRYATGTINEFIALAEQKSGKQLDELFNTWLFTKGKPQVSAATGVPASAMRVTAPPKAAAEIDRTHETLHQNHHH